jgi:hypothetical protein
MNNPDPDFLPIPDPGSGSRIRIRNTFFSKKIAHILLAHIDMGDPREASHDAKNAEDVLHHVGKLFLQLPRAREQSAQARQQLVHLQQGSVMLTTHTYLLMILLY